MFDQFFSEKFPEVKTNFGDKEITVRRVQEFDNGTISGGCLRGYNHNNIDEFLRTNNYDYYLIAGRYNCFISHVDWDTGYKLFTVDKVNHTPADRQIMQRIFNIHKDLYDGGFGPKPISLLEGSIIEIEKSVGELEKPDPKWVSNILEYCKQKQIYRKTNDAADLAWEVQKRTNVIKTKAGYHFIDVDYKMEYYG